MSKLQFFTGERFVRDFVIKLHGGDVVLKCKIFEKWVEKLARSLNCGRSRELTFKKTVGVTITHREELEAAISSSLGKGVAELKSEIRSKSGIEISFEVTEEQEETFTVTAPKCGRTTFQAYQLLRLYKFTYRDNRSAFRRFFSPLKKAPKGFEEWLNQVYDASDTDEVDPDCLAMHPECGRTPVTPPDGFVNLVFDKFGLLTSYRVGEEGILLTKVNATVPTKNIEDLLSSNVTFDRNLIPPYLLFLSGVGQGRLTAQVQPYRGELAVAQKISRSGTSRRESLSFKNVTTGIHPLVVGGAIGATVALLLTTKSGQKLLQSVADVVGDVLESSAGAPTRLGAVSTGAERSQASTSQVAKASPASERPAAGAGASGNW